MQRNLATFDDLVRAGSIDENTRFTMRYDNRTYNAKIVKNAQNIFYLVLLDENGNFYRDPNTNKIIGVYNTPSRAAMDAVNFYRKQHDLPFIQSLRGTTYWIADNGRSFFDMVNGL